MGFILSKGGGSSSSTNSGHRSTTSSRRYHNTSRFLLWIPFFQPHIHVVMLGLDSSGKTTALYKLHTGQYHNTVPTIGFNVEKIKVREGPLRGKVFDMWDLGGQDKLRPLWRSYTRCTDGIVFVVDSVDEERLEEAKLELQRTIKQPENFGTPLLVLANKQDLPGAKDANEIARFLGLTELPPSQPWHVEPTCAVTGEGLEDCLEKLYEMIMQKRHGSSYQSTASFKKGIDSSTSRSRTFNTSV